MNNSFLTGFLTATFAFALATGCSLGTKKVIVGTKDEVRYSGTATEADAKALGESLKTKRTCRIKVSQSYSPKERMEPPSGS